MKSKVLKERPIKRDDRTTFIGGSSGTIVPPNASKSLSRGICDHTDSFRNLESGAPKSKASEVRLSWLRSQIIGEDIEFNSPFGKRAITYADHTASGRSFLYIEYFIINNVLPFYGNTHTGDSHVGHKTTKMVHEASHYIKNCLGGGEDDAIIFCGSGSTAAIKRLQEVMGIAVPSILRERVMETLSSEEKWVVFVGPFEHHSNLLSWRQSLAEVVEIGLDQNGLLDMEALRLQLESYKYANRPMLGSFSACSNVTGMYSDTRSIAHLLHQYGAYACFDFAASGPYAHIDMRSGKMDGYDAIFLSPHKFLGGPGTPGILLMNKALYQLRSSPPSTCGGGTVAYVNGFSEEDTLYYEDVEGRENAGTPPIIQTIRAALAFWIKEYTGYEVIERQEHMYIEKALKRLLPNKNIHILGTTSEKRQAVLSFIIYSTTNSYSNDLENWGENYSIEGEREEGLNMWRETGYIRDKALHGPFVAVLLNDLFGIQARGGCACAGPYGHKLLKVDEASSRAYRTAIKEGYNAVKPGWTRLSFPYYMSNEEFEFILDALEFIATYGQRFLPLYKLNLLTGSWTIKNKALLCLSKDKNGSVHMLPMANGIKARNMNVEEFKDANKNNEGTIKMFASYLETALMIAHLLPKFPMQRKFNKEDVNLSFLQFRV